MMVLESAYILFRGVHFTSVMLLTGASCFSVWLAPLAYRHVLVARLRLLVALCCLMAFISAMGILCVQVGLMSGDWHRIADTETWCAMLSTGFGRIWRWQPVLALMSGYGAGVFRRSYPRWVLFCGMLQLLAMSWVGHAAMQEGWPAWFHGINQMFHLWAVAFWVGGLSALTTVLRDVNQCKNRTLAIATMMRFSRYGHVSVAMVLVTGAINTVLILGWPVAAAAFYGALLTVKVLLVAVMVLLALVNRYWVVPRFRKTHTRAARYFLYITYSELLLAVLVILFVSVFATLSPI